MKIASEPLAPDAVDQALGELTRESIAEVKDFTARKTLEQAHAFARGIAEVFLGEIDSADLGQLDRADPIEIAQRLAGVGLGPDDARQIAEEGVALMHLMAERERRAELFHATVIAARESERALYERLSSLGGLLRARLGPRAPALSQFGVPPESADTVRCQGRNAHVDPAATIAPPPPK